eukprot:387762_1
MASLPVVIRFCASVDKLTGTEFNKFILTLVDKCGRDTLITSLFTMLIANRSSNQETLDSTLNIIKQIIESIVQGKPNQSQPVHTTFQCNHCH